MDPIAHTFAGAVLARTGLERATPLAAAALIIGANAPDIDVVASFGGDYASLAWRRGWTHGLLALLVLPFVVTGALLLWDRWRQRGGPSRAERARAGPLLGLATIGVLSHPTLDWLNNYGLRWLMPFDGRWFYGDALFIIDPWVWLLLGGVLFVAHSRSAASLAAWAAFWLLASWLVMTTDFVPVTARIVWTVGLAALLAIRFVRGAARRFESAEAARVSAPTTAAGAPPAQARLPKPQLAARAAVAVVAAYMAAAAAANLPARAAVRAALEQRGVVGITDVMVAPVAADPFGGTVVAATSGAYHVGDWHWLERPRFTPSPGPIARLPVDDPVIAAAARTREARHFLTWSRFPFFVVEPEADGHVVRFLDARYAGTPGRLTGPVVRVGRDLKPLDVR